MTITWITSTYWTIVQSHCISFWWVHIFDTINDTIRQRLIRHVTNTLHQPNPILMIQFIFTIDNPVQLANMDSTVVAQIDNGDLVILKLEPNPISKCVRKSFHVHTITHLHPWWSINPLTPVSHHFHTYSKRLSCPVFWHHRRKDITFHHLHRFNLHQPHGYKIKNVFS